LKGKRKMPSTVTFWWFPEEENAFLDFLDTTGSVLALPFCGAKKKEDLIPCPIRDYIATVNPRQCFLFLTDFANEIVITSFNQVIDNEMPVEKFRISDMRSSVLGYDRGVVAAPNRLTASNLYAYWEFPDPGGKVLTRKSEAFSSWGKRVMKWVLKATPEWHTYKNYRVSKRVKNAILDNRLEIGF
jgi:hypothetical protein